MIHGNTESQKGDKNSQFGTCWITNGKEAIKIEKSEFPKWRIKGYSLGRKLRHNENCLNCNTSLVGLCGSKFCSNTCQGEYQRQDSIRRIELGEKVSHHVLKSYLLEKFKHICQDCGTGNIWNNKPLTLQIDHVDGNSDNNKLDNLTVLCPNCHTQTSTWCARNIKNTKRSKYARTWRKKITLR